MHFARGERYAGFRNRQLHKQDFEKAWAAPFSCRLDFAEAGPVERGTAFMSPGLDNDSRTAWISQGFERLLDRVRRNPAAVHFDVLIIGSGYGGAIAAATFAGRTKAGVPVTVGVLE